MTTPDECRRAVAAVRADLRHALEVLDAEADAAAGTWPPAARAVWERERARIAESMAEIDALAAILDENLDEKLGRPAL
ncbi:hypothetical protein [Actinomycetospora sp. NBRC 106378]|uniref:hypothetical protein n=1 Tax=Actinomycetospora sp. NBRC 106378 TaxID=3032208 RepID=UPI0024A1F8A5|nr:hypothetical protein [Actinomycetospora sp. NBRC 106378]GLZ53155.1 hypothetical protein Acsp07_27720 [Actinomycetospora sp. NBRC 106378]